MVQLAAQAIFEELPHLAVASVDARNAFNAIFREAIMASLAANPRLHPLIPIYKLLYLDRATELLYYQDGPSRPPRVILSKRGVRQGCPLGSALFCIALAPVIRRLRTIAGTEAVALAYVDDINVALEPQQLPALDVALDDTLGTVGLEPVRDRGKSFVVPHRLTPSPDLPLDQGTTGRLPPTTIEQRPGLKRCLGCPRHPTNDADYIASHLQDAAIRHDRLLDVITQLAHSHPHAALRILQVAGIRRFQHLMRVLPPDISADFLQGRDDAVLRPVRAILRLTPDQPIDQVTLARARAPLVLGGLNAASLCLERQAAFVSCHALTLGPLAGRLETLGGPSHRRLAAALRSYTTSPHPWAVSLRSAYTELADQIHIEPWMCPLLNAMAPLTSRFTTAGDPCSLTDVPLRTEQQSPLPPLADLCPPEGGTRRKAFPKLSFRLRAKSPMAIQPDLSKLQRLQMLSSSGKGSVAFLASDSSRLHDASSVLQAATIRRAIGLPALWDPAQLPKTCPFCRQTGSAIDVLLHMFRCGRSPAFHTAHAVLAQAIRRCCEQAGASDADLRGGKKGSPELRGLRPDGTRPSDVTWLNFHGRGKHLLIDATVVSVYVASMLKNQRFNQPGYAVEQAEARKFSNDVTSRASVAGTHRLVPFAVEESGRFGDHSLRLLREIATRGVDNGCLLPPSSWLSFKKTRLVSYWVDMWLQDISLSLAQHLTSLVVDKLCS